MKNPLFRLIISMITFYIVTMFHYDFIYFTCVDQSSSDNMVLNMLLKIAMFSLCINYGLYLVLRTFDPKNFVENIQGWFFLGGFTIVCLLVAKPELIGYSPYPPCAVKGSLCFLIFCFFELFLASFRFSRRK